MSAAWLASLLRGDDAPLLQNCRFEGAGTVAYGRDEIAGLFARSGAADEMQVVGGNGHAAVFAGETALVADTHDGWIGRIWYCGASPVGSPRPASVDVPFDPDLDQRGGSVAFDPADHPALAAADVAVVGAFAARYLGARGEAGLARTRPLVLRAFSAPAGAVALLMVQGMAGDGRPRLVRYAVAALLLRDGEPVIVADLAGLADAAARPWTPRL